MEKKYESIFCHARAHLFEVGQPWNWHFSPNQRRRDEANAWKLWIQKMCQKKAYMRHTDTRVSIILMKNFCYSSRFGFCSPLLFCLFLALRFLFVSWEQIWSFISSNVVGKKVDDGGGVDDSDVCEWYVRHCDLRQQMHQSDTNFLFSSFSQRRCFRYKWNAFILQSISAPEWNHISALCSTVKRMQVHGK